MAATRTRAKVTRPTEKEAAEAVRTLIRWAGDDPTREGLLDTPMRVVRSYREFVSGYGQDPNAILARTFSEVEGYDEMIVMNDIRFESHCEHHMVPIIGKAHIGYLPDRRVVGRLVRVLSHSIRTTDHLGWFSGSRIGVLLPGTAPEGARRFVEQFAETSGMRDVAGVTYSYPDTWYSNGDGQGDRGATDNR